MKELLGIEEDTEYLIEELLKVKLIYRQENDSVWDDIWGIVELLEQQYVESMDGGEQYEMPAERGVLFALKMMGGLLDVEGIEELIHFMKKLLLIYILILGIIITLGCIDEDTNSEVFADSQINNNSGIQTPVSTEKEAKILFSKKIIIIETFINKLPIQFINIPVKGL